MNPKKKALGRGLSAILESPQTDITSQDISGNFVAGAIASLPITQIEANPFQPRTAFDEETLNDLAASIKEQGIIQPLTVRKMGYDKYRPHRRRAPPESRTNCRINFSPLLHSHCQRPANARNGFGGKYSTRKSQCH